MVDAICDLLLRYQFGYLDIDILASTWSVERTAPFLMTLNDLTQISRSHHYLTLSISETVRDGDIVTREY